MNPERITDLSHDLWHHVFESLDIEPDLDGDGAGKVAAAVESAFGDALRELFN